MIVPCRLLLGLQFQLVVPHYAFISACWVPDFGSFCADGFGRHLVGLLSSFKGQITAISVATDQVSHPEILKQAVASAIGYEPTVRLVEAKNTQVATPTK